MVYLPPNGHLEDSLKMEADGLAELFEIQLTSGSVIRLKPNNDVTWQGNLWEGIAIQLTGLGQHATEQVARPQLNVVNVKGVFSSVVAQGDLDLGTVIRRQVLYDDLINDRGIYTEQSWRIFRCVNLNKNLIAFQLRGQMDGQFFQIPPRMYMPPDFPQVSLQ